jgi:hypothetical protein
MTGDPRPAGTAPALNSWIATAVFLIPSLPFLLHRAMTEDRLLTAELSGYRDYAERVRWRLIPGIWSEVPQRIDSHKRYYGTFSISRAKSPENAKLIRS